MNGRFAAALLVLLAGSAFGKAFQGIEPGVSTRQDVIKKFGEPSKEAESKDGKEILGYTGARAPKTTSQAQFRLDPDTWIVERIDIFPKEPITRFVVIEKYGRQCPEKRTGDEDPCFVVKYTGDQKAYLFYAQFGLAVFFKADGETVQTLVFTPTKKRDGD